VEFRFRFRLDGAQGFSFTATATTNRRGRRRRKIQIHRLPVCGESAGGKLWRYSRSGTVEMQQQGQDRRDEGIKRIKRIQQRDSGRVDRKRVCRKREREERLRGGGGRGEKRDCARALIDVEGEGSGVAGEEGRVDEVVVGGVAVPEEVCGFGGADAQEGFGLEVLGVFAVEGVGDGDGGGVVDCEEFGEGGEDVCDEG